MTNKSTPPETLSLTHPNAADVIAVFKSQPRQDRPMNPPVPADECQALSDAFDWLHSLPVHDDVNPLPGLEFFVMALQEDYPEEVAELKAHVKELYDL